MAIGDRLHRTIREVSFLRHTIITMNYLSWVNLMFGLWVFVSPWVLGFAGYPLALWSNILSGVGVVVLVLWTLLGKRDANR